MRASVSEFGSEPDMKEFFNNLNSIMQKKQKRQMVALIFLMVISAVLEVCGISSVLPIVSALLDKDFMYTNFYAKYLCELLGIVTYEGFVIACISMLLIVFIVKNVVLIINDIYYAKYTLDFQYDLRKRIFHRYLGKDYSFYFENNSSEIYKTLIDDVANVNATYSGLLTILTESIISIFLFIAVLVIDWRISLVMSFIMLLVSIAISRLIRPVIKKNGEMSFEASKIRNKWILQALQGIKTVKATEKNYYFENKAYKTDLDFSKAEKNHRVLTSIPRMILELFSIMAFVILIAVLVLKGDNFELLIPKISAIGLAFIKLMPGANSVISNIVSIRYRTPSVKRVTELMMEEEKTCENGAFPDQYFKSIEASGISFRYGENCDYILKDASLSIPIGKMIGIVGASGEGKTTFVDILLGLLPIEKGDIFVDGVSIYNNISKWRESIGYITQDVFLLDDTIKANVAFGVEEASISDEQVWNALEKAQLADFVRSQAEGIHSKIGEKGIKLSGGQRQRIGIARALYNDPQILIFDEATSSLDTNTERDVVDAINSLYGEHTILVIAHRSVALGRCDYIYKIKKGIFTYTDI